jgi:hypothetical protein
MSRFSAAAAILICLFLIAPQPAAAQDCFPWQELRDGRCVAKPSEILPPALPPPPPTISDQCPIGSRNLSAKCSCPANTHFDRPSGTCVADVTPAAPSPPPLAPAPTALAPEPPAPPPPSPAVAPLPPAPPLTNQAVFCDGGNVINGSCACPAGFHVMAISGVAVGGRCVKTDAENCLGGELTVTGFCQCNGQVTMSGEVYLLEFVKGKCIPQRCPLQTVLKDGQCLKTSATTPAPEPESTGKVTPAAPLQEAKKEPADSDDDDHRRHCGRGMVRNRAGECVSRRRAPSGLFAGPYFRLYRGW